MPTYSTPISYVYNLMASLHKTIAVWNSSYDG